MAAATPSRPTGSIMGFFAKGKTTDPFKAASEQAIGSAPRPTSAKSAASHPGSASSSAASSNSGPRTAQASSRIHDNSNAVVVNQLADPLYTKSQAALSNFNCPKVIGKSLTIVSLGKLPSTSSPFVTETGIFPVGFEATREYSSYKNVGSKTQYTFSIQAGSTAYSLQFSVSAADDASQPCSGSTPAAAWKLVKERLEAAGIAMKSKKAAAWWFGLKEPSVLLALQGMPGIPGSAYVLKDSKAVVDKKKAAPAVKPAAPAAPAAVPEQAAVPAHVIQAGAVNIILDDTAPETPSAAAAVDTAPASALQGAPATTVEPASAPVDEDGDVDLTANAEGASGNSDADPAASETHAAPEHQDRDESAPDAATPAPQPQGSDEVATAPTDTVAGAAAAAAFASIPAASAPAPAAAVLATDAQAAVPAVVVEWFIPTALVPACIATVHGKHATKKELITACATACPGTTLKALRSTIGSVTMQITDKALGLKRAWCVRQSVLDAVGVTLAPGAVPAVADPGVTARAAPGVDDAAQAAAEAAATPSAAAAATAAAPAPPVVADARFAEYVEQLRSKCNTLKEEHGLGVAVVEGGHPFPLRRSVPGAPTSDLAALVSAITASTGDEDALKRKVALDAFVAMTGHASPCESVEVTAQAMHSLLLEQCGDDAAAAVPARSNIETVVRSALTWRSVNGTAKAAPGVSSTVEPLQVSIGYWEAPAALLKAASKDVSKETYEDVRDCGEALRTALSTAKALLRVASLLGGPPDKVAAAESNGKLSAAQADLLRKQEAEAVKVTQRQERLEKRAAAAEAAAAKEAEAQARKAAAAEEKEAKKLKKAGVSSAQQKIMASFFGAPPAGAEGTPSKPKPQARTAAAADATPSKAAATPADTPSASPVQRALIRATESEEDAACRAATTARLDAAYAAAQAMDEEELRASQAQLLADTIARGRTSRASASKTARRASRRRLRAQLRAVVVDGPIDELLHPPANTAGVPAAGGGEAETAAPAWAGGKVLKHAAGAGAVQLPGDDKRLLVPAHFGKPKLMHFGEDRRPPYWGTWSKRPLTAPEGGVARELPPLKGPDAMPATLQDGTAAWYVEPAGEAARVGCLAARRPLACDTRLFDYMVDSEAEWESEDEDAEDLASDEEEDEEEEEEAVAPVGTAAGYDYEDGFMALDTVVHYAAGGQEDEEGDVTLGAGASPAANPVKGGVKRPREGPSGEGGSAPKCARVLTGLAASIAQASGDASGVGGATGKRVLKFGVVHDVASHAQAGNDTAKKLAPILRPMAGIVTSFVRPSVCMQYSQTSVQGASALPRFSLPSFEPARVFGKVKVRKTGDIGAKAGASAGSGRGQTHFPTADAAVQSLKAIMRGNNRPYEKVADLWMAQHGPQWPGTTCASVRRAVLQLGKREKGHNKPWHLHGEPAPVMPVKVAKPGKAAAALPAHV